MIIDHHLGPLPASNFMSGRSGHSMQWASAQDPSYIVIHTMVGTLASANATFHVDGHSTSAHYGITANELAQWVSEDDTAFHSGNWEMNLNSIGIEHEDNGDYDGPRPDALYVRSGALVRWICDRYGIPISRQWIIRHNEVPGSSTGCPDALDIDRIVAEATTSTGGLDMATRADSPELFSLLDLVVARIGGASGNATLTEDFQSFAKWFGYDPATNPNPLLGAKLDAVIAAVADLKAHPVAVDPEVKALLLKIEKALQGA